PFRAERPAVRFVRFDVAISRSLLRHFAVRFRPDVGARSARAGEHSGDGPCGVQADTGATMVRRLGLGIVLVCWATDARAQIPTAADIPRPTVRAAARSGAITIDGAFTEEAWSAAQPATDFLQLEPDEGRPAQRTEVRFLYDESA